VEPLSSKIITATQLTPHIWIFSMTFIQFILLLWVPFIKACLPSKKVYRSRQDFDKILVSPTLYDAFKPATIPDFSAHFVLFDLHVCEILEQISYQLDEEKEEALKRSVPDNFKRKIGEIYRLYFSKDAPFKVIYFPFYKLVILTNLIDSCP
jgi:hypothetical protein